jgi:hypothetical protein
MSERGIVYSGVDVIEAMIQETVAVSANLPVTDDRFLVNNGIGTRLMVLMEAKAALVKAYTRHLEEQHEIAQ